MGGANGVETGLGILTTRIGRRFVWMFLGCAFVPLVAFALLALLHVSTELRRQNELSLHDGAKTAGMGIAARLSQLAGDFGLLREAVRRLRDGQALPDAVALVEPLRQRCASVWVADGSNVQVLWGAGARPILNLQEVELLHLAMGKPLLRSPAGAGPLVACASLQPGAAASPILVAELQSGWLWDVEELRVRGSEVAVFDGARNPLFHSFRQLPEVAPLFAAVVRQPASGSVDWQVGDAAHIARYWRAFLRPQYGLDLLIVQSRARSDVLTAVHGFEKWFALLALGALLCVLVTSLVQMRRTLGPIVALGEATRRVAAGDFTAHVAIRSRDEFGDLGVAFNHMTRQLAENVRRREQIEHDLVASRDAALAAVRAKAEFVTNVSHEFRTPMTEILTATEILASFGDGDPAVSQEFATMAHLGAQRLSCLVDDVLELGAGSQWQLEPTDLGATITEALAALPESVASRVRVRVAEALPRVDGVHHRLVDTWLRLLDNAVKFSPAESPIELRATVVGANVVVEVQDQGVGISRLELDHIFEPFQQVGRDQLTNKANGTGLGLTIARNTVERQGGRIEVDSELGNGATFRVLLPVLVDSTV